MESIRHPLAREPLGSAVTEYPAIGSAQLSESSGKWYLAGEQYSYAAEQVRDAETETRAKLLARAATCFEIAGQARGAARAFSAAASELDRNRIHLRTAGELYSRAALQFRNLGEHFNAGICWRSAGSAFAQSPELNMSGLDGIPPIPSAAGKFTVAARWYTAAGDAFLLAGDEAMWSCGAYWEAGKAHSAQGHGYHAFVGYRKALTSVARFYGTHDREELRRCLPLTEEERAAMLDPLAVMEQQAHMANGVHQQRNGGILKTNWAQVETDRQMITAYHEFYLAFVSIGNNSEAGNYRAAEKDRTRRL